MNDLNTYTLNYQGAKTENKEKKSIFKHFLTAAVGIIMLSIIFISIFSLIGSGENSGNFVSHEIESGESLWSIAAHYYDSNNVDLRKIIYDIKKINDINSSVITPGKELIIPIN
ncbi:MAG: cell division suppressor protein YneA [bacterium]